MSMNKSQSQSYNVVIMGAGIAGVAQARHLLLNIPNIKLALIDPRLGERTEKDLKVGESAVEISTLLICKELGLYDYMKYNWRFNYSLKPKVLKNPILALGNTIQFSPWVIPFRFKLAADGVWGDWGRNYCRILENWCNSAAVRGRVV